MNDEARWMIGKQTTTTKKELYSNWNKCKRKELDARKWTRILQFFFFIFLSNLHCSMRCATRFDIISCVRSLPHFECVRLFLDWNHYEIYNTICDNFFPHFFCIHSFIHFIRCEWFVIYYGRLWVNAERLYRQIIQNFWIISFNQRK